MRKHFFKLIFLVVAVMMLATIVLTACSGPTSGFTNPSMPTAGEVSSNGGLAVQYGEYIYYVNGNQTTATSTNKYTGEVKTGDIVRIKVSDLQQVLALNDDKSLKGADLTEAIQKKMFESAEVVVPMFYYTGNTTEKNVNGLFIYNDMLYFTSPSTNLSAGGNVQNDKLSVYRCKLDGTELTNMYTMDALTYPNALFQKGDKVYLVYVAEDLMCVDLSTPNGEAKKISEKVTSPKFDITTSSVVYLNKDGKICKFTAGNTEETVLVDNADKDKVTYTIKQYNNGYVYYTKADTENSTADFGVFAVKEGQESKIILDATKDAAGTAYTYLCYNEKVVMTGTVANTEISAYQLYMTSGNADPSNTEYLLPKDTNDKSITLDRIEGDILYYTRDGKMYSMDLSSTSGYTAVELNSTVTANGWAMLDTITVDNKTLFVAFDSATGISVYEYKEVDGENKQVATAITVIKPTEDEE